MVDRIRLVRSGVSYDGNVLQAAVCTENSVRVDYVSESPSWILLNPVGSWAFSCRYGVVDHVGRARLTSGAFRHGYNLV
jgi:hypothetical protein